MVKTLFGLTLSAMPFALCVSAEAKQRVSAGMPKPEAGTWGATAREPGLALFARAKLLRHKRDYGPGRLHSLCPLLFGIRLKRNGRRSKNVRVACGNVVLIQDSCRTDMAREILIDLGAQLRQLRHGVNWDGALPLGNEKTFKGFLARLFGHKTGIGVVLSHLMVLRNTKVGLGLAEPAKPSFRAWLHRRASLLGGFFLRWSFVQRRTLALYFKYLDRTIDLETSEPETKVPTAVSSVDPDLDKKRGSSCSLSRLSRYAHTFVGS